MPGKALRVVELLVLYGRSEKYCCWIKGRMDSCMVAEKAAYFFNGLSNISGCCTINRV